MRLGGEREACGESTACMGKIGRDQERLLEEIFIKEIFLQSELFSRLCTFISEIESILLLKQIE